MTRVATRVPGRLTRGPRLRGRDYQCWRCGHIQEWKQAAGAKRPDQCQSCTDVLALEARQR